MGNGMKDGRRTRVSPGATALAIAALPAATLRAGPGTLTPPPVCPPWALPCAGHGTKRSQMQNLPAILKRGQPDLCHGDGRFGNSERSDHFLRGRNVGADLGGQVTIMITATIYCVLPVGQVLCRAHVISEDSPTILCSRDCYYSCFTEE